MPRKKKATKKTTRAGKPNARSEERQKAVNTINALVDQGMTIAKACEEAGVKAANYYRWKQKAAPDGARSHKTKGINRKRTNRDDRKAAVESVEKLVADGLGVQEACDKLKINSANYYRWRAAPKQQYGSRTKPVKATSQRMFEATVLLTADKVLSEIPTDMLLAEIQKRVS